MRVSKGEIQRWRQIATGTLGILIAVACSRGEDFGLEGGCSASQNNSRGIRNGTSDTVCQYRAAIAIAPVGAKSFSEIFCSGTLVEPDIVITAAHCISRGAQEQYGNKFVVATTGSPAIAVTGYIAHPKFIETSDSVGGVDIGVLHLQKAMDGVTPIPLGAVVPAEGSSATAVGYGYDGNGADGDGRLGIRRTTTMRIQDVGGLALVQASDDVANSLANTMSVSSQETCAADSGGPLLVANALLGVLSGGTYTDESATCRAAADSDYILVAPFRTWIAQAIARLRAGQ